MHEPDTPQLERSPTVASLASQATRVAPAPDCRGAWRQPRGRQPVGDTSPRGRPRGAPSPASPPHSSPSCLACSSAAPKRTASGGSSGPAAGSLRSFSWCSACPIIRAMSAACARRSAGARKSRRDVPASATTRRLPAGASRPGRPSKRGGGPVAHDSLHR